MTRTRSGAVPESSPSGPPPLDLVVFTVIVDDLVFADGATRMGVLGGGGPQTAFGFRTHPGDFSVGLAAGVGPDFPNECADWLDANGVDTEGLMLVRDERTNTSGAVEGEGDGGDEEEGGSSWEGGGASASAFVARRESALAEKTNAQHPFRPTPRAWQITEHDGRRTQVWRTPANAHLYAMLRPPAETLPPRYRGAKAFHVGVHPERPDATLLKALREKGIFGGDDEKNKNENASTRVLLSVEPFTRATRPVSIETLHTLCSAGDVFSPNELEAVSLVGEGSPAELCRRLADAGAKIVCVRRGEKGAVVHNAATGETWDVPAFLEDQSRLADVTGCGNAFCGGFMAGLVSGESLDRAACWGSAAASVMAEHVGVPTVPAGDARTRAEVRRRFEALLRRTAKIDE